MQEQLELLQSLDDYLPRLYKGIKQNIDYYRTKQIAMGDELIIQVLDGLSWSLDAIVLTQEVQTQVVTLDGVKEVLVEMLEGMENADKVLIADILEYEVLERVKEWSNITHATLIEKGLVEVN